MTSGAPSIAAEIMAGGASSYPGLFRRRVADTPERVAFLTPPDEPEQPWGEITWRQVGALADAAGAGMVALGLIPTQRVAIACSTRIEWVLADLGIALAAGVTTTIYPNTNADDVRHIVTDSETSLMVVEDAAQLAKVRSLPEFTEQVRHVVVIDDDLDEAQRSDPRVLTWQELLDLGRDRLAADPGCLDERIAALGLDDLSTLIYTSGTTGAPKGVELLHRAWLYEGACIKYLNFVFPDDLLYLWLPLSHVFGRDLLSVQLAIGFRAAIDGRVDRIVEGLGATHPTVFVGVPRIFEKVRAAVMTAYPQNGLKGRISRWAFAVGRDSRPFRLAGRPLPPLLRIAYAIADRLVFSQLKTRLGGNLRMLISGSAKLSSQVQEWFYSAGLTIIEGYGATETAAIAFLNLPDRPRFGTVGPVIPGLETKLDADGEVMVKGPTIAQRYHNLPEETAEAFVDGWYRTGDIGVLDADGYLTITDRKKDLFKTSNGKFVAPQKVENTVMANIPYVSQVVAIVENRKYVTALLALDPASLAKWAARRGKDGLSHAELVALPEVRESIDRRMRSVNNRLERWEQIKRYTILPHELTLADGTLTPSLKVRRGAVHEKYAEEIEAMYSDASHSDLAQ